MISGVVVGTLQIDLFNDPNAVCNSGSLIGAVATQWNSATEDPPTGKTVILHQSKQRIRGLVGCCRRYRAMAPGGSRDGVFRYFRAELSRRSEKLEERLGVGPLVWLSEGPSQDNGYQDDDPDPGDTGLPRRLLDGRRGLQSSGRMLRIAF